MSEFTYCHDCGAPYAFDDRLTKQWPRTCESCHRTVWKNPIPVVVSIVRVNGPGLLTVRRNIEPEKGKLAFPGGYIDYGETWQQAAARELYEETSTLIDVDPDYFELLGVEHASSTGNILIFCHCLKVIQSVDDKDIENFKPNPEVSELRVIHTPTELAWPTHTEFAKRYFARG
jgi:ADP-ribose pyrophosphatase YjhB (NUDIX family)